MHILLSSTVSHPPLTDYMHAVNLLAGFMVFQPPSPLAIGFPYILCGIALPWICICPLLKNYRYGFAHSWAKS